MDANPETLIAESGLRELEKRVDELIRVCARLREENESLRARQKVLIAERAELIEKSELAQGRVEAIMSRLKSREQTS